MSLPDIHFVGHTHAIHVNQILCSPRAREFAAKKLFPDETKINLSAEENIRYEVLVNVMDAARENPFERDESNNPTQLFYDVVFAAGL